MLLTTGGAIVLLRGIMGGPATDRVHDLDDLESHKTALPGISFKVGGLHMCTTSQASHTNPTQASRVVSGTNVFDSLAVCRSPD